jgi:hypothetical protein
MHLSDLNIAKTNRDVEDIKVRLDELILCLADREQKILDAIAEGKQRDMSTAEIIETQKAAIAKLEDLNCVKDKKLTGLTKLVILAVLGVFSMTVQYNVAYNKGDGITITPHPNPGAVLPAIYALSIIAIASGQDEKIGLMLETVGRKLGT